MIKLTQVIQILSLVLTDLPQKSDALILLEGDGYHRAETAVRLFKKGRAKKLVISGGVNRPEIGCYPASSLARFVQKRGIPKSSLILEESSQHTRQQALEVMKLVRLNQWKRIMLIASAFHQLRAFLTFLKAMQENNLKIEIINVPAQNLPWFKKSPWGPSRVELLEAEIRKINQYAKKGHLATFEEAMRYYRWREGLRY